MLWRKSDIDLQMKSRQQVLLARKQFNSPQFIVSQQKGLTTGPEDWFISLIRLEIQKQNHKTFLLGGYVWLEQSLLVVYWETRRYMNAVKLCIYLQTSLGFHLSYSKYCE